jgi:hypothetical protein
VQAEKTSGEPGSVQFGSRHSTILPQPVIIGSAAASVQGWPTINHASYRYLTSFHHRSSFVRKRVNVCVPSVAQELQGFAGLAISRVLLDCNGALRLGAL